MKKFLFILFGVFVVIGAFAAGENIPTSKSYVDSKLDEKQDIIPANDGTTQVLTNTGTAGEYGTKGIYDANGEYATQAQNLVDAATMNAGVQNAIDNEFSCIESDGNGGCMLMSVNILPNDYSRLQYLESTGTQYIDPDISADSNTGISIKYAYTTLGASKYIFGSFVPHYYLGINSYGSDMVASYGSNAGNTVLDIPIANVQPKQIFTFNMNFLNSGTAEFIGITSTQLPQRTFSNNSKKMLLFGLTPTATHPYTSASRIYNVQISAGSSLVRNMVPVTRNSDDELGMYDFISQTFFTNAGSGKFKAGQFIPHAN